MRFPRRAVHVLTVFTLLVLSPVLLRGTADVSVAADAPVGFVGVAHSDPASQKFKSVAVSGLAQAGDTAVMIFTRATTVTWTGPTGVTGWTQVDSFANTGLTSTVWTKTLGAGDVGALVRFDTANFAKAMLSVAVYSGVDPTVPVVTHAADSAVTNHTTPLVTATADDWVVSYWVDKADTTTAWTPPASVTSRDVAIGTGSGRYSSLLADSGGPVSAGSYGGKVATTNADSRALMWSIALPGDTQTPVNQPPVAAFTSDCDDLSCDFDGSDSSDSDGTVDAYEWDFGDGNTATGETPATHTYGAEGDYLVQLSVTDDDLATDTVSHLVSVGTQPEPEVDFVGAAHSDASSQRFKTATLSPQAQAGDTAVLVMTRATTVTWTGPTGVTGWTQEDSFASGGLTSTVWTKTVAAGEPGDVVRFDTANFAKAMVTVAVYSGVDASGPAVTHRADSAVTSHTTPLITTSTDDWVASYWVDKSDTTTTWTPPASVTSRDVAIGTGTGRYSSLLADSGGPVSAASYGGKVATTNAASRALMWSIALPSGPTTPPPDGDVTKLMVIVEENKTIDVVDNMPFLKGLSDTYGHATNFHGLVHPSEGNYIAMVSGQGANTCGLNNPLPAACPQPGPTVFGQAIAAGKTAKTYAESMVGNCRKTNNTLYAVRHNPWPYFSAEAANCATFDVPLGTTSSGAFISDINAGALPNASMVVPNLINDAHDGTVEQADDWLADWVPRIMAGPDYQAGNLAIVVTFDEGIGANQNIPFIVVSPGATGIVATGNYDHYHLARLYADILGVPPLNLANGAPGLRAAFGL